MKATEMVTEFMSTDVGCCDRHTPLQEVAKLMIDCDCGEIPVTDEDLRLVGVVTDRDIVCRAVALGRNPSQLRAGDVMTAPAITVKADQTLGECCELLEHNQIRRVPVVDDGGRCIGIVSQADIAQCASKSDTARVVRRVSERSVSASAV